MRHYSVLEENGTIVEREAEQPLVTGNAARLDVTHVGVSHLDGVRDHHVILALATSGTLPRISIKTGVLSAAYVEASPDVLSRDGVHGRVGLSPAP